MYSTALVMCPHHFLDLYRNTALHMAAWHSKSDIIDVLVMNGIDVDKQNINGCTALHLAVQHCVQGKLFTVSKLLQGRARIDIRSVDGDTALDFASRYDKRGVWKVPLTFVAQCRGTWAVLLVLVNHLALCFPPPKNCVYSFVPSSSPLPPPSSRCGLHADRLPSSGGNDVCPSSHPRLPVRSCGGGRDTPRGRDGP